MSNLTTTPYNHIRAELINTYQYDEFIESDRFIERSQSGIVDLILNYDDRVAEIVNNDFFRGLKLENAAHDAEFKRQWIARFYARQIKQQTIEAFSGSVVAVFLKHKNILNAYYTNFLQYTQGYKATQTTGESQLDQDTRTANQTLPQSQINLDLDNRQADFADDAFMSAGRQDKQDQQTQVTQDYDPKALIELRTVTEPVMIDFDKECFSQVFL